jgi:hypothetical protein
MEELAQQIEDLYGMYWDKEGDVAVVTYKNGDFESLWTESP